jgi:hypothetical protein
LGKLGGNKVFLKENLIEFHWDVGSGKGEGSIHSFSAYTGGDLGNWKQLLTTTFTESYRQKPFLIMLGTSETSLEFFFTEKELPKLSLLMVCGIGVRLEDFPATFEA